MSSFRDQQIASIPPLEVLMTWTKDRLKEKCDYVAATSYKSLNKEDLCRKLHVIKLDYDASMMRARRQQTQQQQPNRPVVIDITNDNSTQVSSSNQDTAAVCTPDAYTPVACTFDAIIKNCALESQTTILTPYADLLVSLFNNTFTCDLNALKTPEEQYCIGLWYNYGKRDNLNALPYLISYFHTCPKDIKLLKFIENILHPLAKSSNNPKKYRKMLKSLYLTSSTCYSMYCLACYYCPTSTDCIKSNQARAIMYFKQVIYMSKPDTNYSIWSYLQLANHVNKTYENGAKKTAKLSKYLKQIEQHLHVIRPYECGEIKALINIYEALKITSNEFIIDILKSSMNANEKIKLFMNNSMDPLIKFRLIHEHCPELLNDSRMNNLSNNPHVQVYRNKIRVCTELNCIKDCPICLESKLNIILNCGHLICVDCYPAIMKTGVCYNRCNCK